MSPTLRRSRPADKSLGDPRMNALIRARGRQIVVSDTRAEKEVLPCGARSYSSRSSDRCF
jgi:hypothetical protein